MLFTCAGCDDPQVHLSGADHYLQVFGIDGCAFQGVQEFCTDTMECRLRDGSVVVAVDWGFYPGNIGAQLRILRRLSPGLKTKVVGGYGGVTILKGANDIPMDPECVAFCAAMNAVPGITTLASCCGHGKDAFYVYFRAENIADLYLLAIALDPIYDGPKGWACAPVASCYDYSVVTFEITSGPNRGTVAYQQAQELAISLRNLLDLRPAWTTDSP